MYRKPWETVPEAVESLKREINGDFTEADIYRFTLSGDLVLSVRFIEEVKARLGVIAPESEFGSRTDHYYTDLPVEVTVGKKVSTSDILMFEEEVVELEGIYDLLMYGDGYKLIEGHCSEALDVTNTLLFSGSGILVRNWENGDIFELVHKLDQATIDRDIEWYNKNGINRNVRRYIPSGRLPAYNCHLCIRAESMKKFIDTTTSTEQRKDSLAIDIDDVIEILKKSGKDISTTVVWNKLVERIGRNDSCCVRLETGGEKDEIAFKSASGNIKRLTRAGLANRLSRLKRK